MNGFERILKVNLVDAGVYLHLHINPDVVVVDAVSRFALDDLVRLALVVSTVGEALVETLCFELQKRALREPEPQLQDQLLLLLETILRQNDTVAEHVLSTFAA